MCAKFAAPFCLFCQKWHWTSCRITEWWTWFTKTLQTSQPRGRSIKGKLRALWSLSTNWCFERTKQIEFCSLVCDRPALTLGAAAPTDAVPDCPSSGNSRHHLPEICRGSTADCNDLLYVENFNPWPSFTDSKWVSYAVSFRPTEL